MHLDEFASPRVQIALDSRSTITEDWQLEVFAADRFKLRGRAMGVVASGALSDVVAPINPATTRPYFTLTFARLGEVKVGDVLSFSTAAPAVARATSSHPLRKAAGGARPRSRSSGSRSHGGATPGRGAAP